MTKTMEAIVRGTIKRHAGALEVLMKHEIVHDRPKTRLHGDERYPGPDGKGLPRLIRRMPTDFLPHRNWLAVLDPARNILFVNTERFDALTPLKRDRLVITHETYVTA